jgi:hypothetical protein
MVLGKKDNTPRLITIQENESITTIKDQDSVKICGITFSNNQNISYENNIIKRIDKMERQLNIWRQRNLTLQGKVLLAKTFGLSQIIYQAQSTCIKKAEIKNIEKVIYKFIWNIKNTNSSTSGKIRRSILELSKEEGGLNVPNIESLDLSLKYKQLLRSITNTHPIGQITKMNMGIQTNEHLPQHVITQKTESQFITRGIIAHNELIKLIDKDIQSLEEDQNTRVNKMYYLHIKNHDIAKSHHLKPIQANSIKKLQQLGIKTVGDLHRSIQNFTHPTAWLEKHQIRNSLPKEWINILNRTSDSNMEIKNMIVTKTNIWKPCNIVTSRELRERLQSKNKQQINITNYISSRHKVELETTSFNPFKTIQRITKEEKIRSLQYKLLHNIYPTMHHLFKWKIKETPNCASCANTEETTVHAIYDCPIAKMTLKNFTEIIRDKINIRLEIDITKMILGIEYNECEWDNNTTDMINLILILIEKRINTSKRTKTRTINKEEILGINNGKAIKIRKSII